MMSSIFSAWVVFRAFALLACWFPRSACASNISHQRVVDFRAFYYPERAAPGTATARTASSKVTTRDQQESDDVPAPDPRRIKNSVSSSEDVWRRERDEETPAPTTTVVPRPVPRTEIEKNLCRTPRSRESLVAERLSLRGLLAAADRGGRIWLSPPPESPHSPDGGRAPATYELPRLEVVSAGPGLVVACRRIGTNAFSDRDRSLGRSPSRVFAITALAEESAAPRRAPGLLHEQSPVAFYTALIHAFGTFHAYLRDTSPAPDDGHRFLQRAFTVFLPPADHISHPHEQLATILLPLTSFYRELYNIRFLFQRAGFSSQKNKTVSPLYWARSMRLADVEEEARMLKSAHLLAVPEVELRDSGMAVVGEQALRRDHGAGSGLSSGGGPPGVEEIVVKRSSSDGSFDGTSGTTPGPSEAEHSESRSRPSDDFAVDDPEDTVCALYNTFSELRKIHEANTTLAWAEAATLNTFDPLRKRKETRLRSLWVAERATSLRRKGGRVEDEALIWDYADVGPLFRLCPMPALIHRMWLSLVPSMQFRQSVVDVAARFFRILQLMRNAAKILINLMFAASESSARADGGGAASPLPPVVAEMFRRFRTDGEPDLGEYRIPASSTERLRQEYRNIIWRSEALKILQNKPHVGSNFDADEASEDGYWDPGLSERERQQLDLMCRLRLFLRFSGALGVPGSVLAFLVFLLCGGPREETCYPLVLWERGTRRPEHARRLGRGVVNVVMRYAMLSTLLCADGINDELGCDCSNHADENSPSEKREKTSLGLATSWQFPSDIPDGYPDHIFDGPEIRTCLSHVAYGGLRTESIKGVGACRSAANIRDRCHEDHPDPVNNAPSIVVPRCRFF